MKVTMFNLMPYPRLSDEVIAAHDSYWVTMPNSYYDPKVGHDAYNRYLDQLELCDELGFDGVAVNEHHQTPYGLMPSPIVTASALARRTKNCKIAILGSAFCLREHPLTLAEEHAMIDNISGGRLITGFVRGVGAEYSVFGVNPVLSHERHYEAHDLVVQARPIRVRGQALPRRIRQRLAAPLSAAASADLVSVAGLQRNHRMGGASRPQISLPAELQSVQRGAEISQLLSRNHAVALWLCRDLGAARLRRAGLRRRHR
jgi:hypothetical protein